MADKNINELEWKMIKEYKITKDENIPLHFYKRFSNDLANIIYSKLNSKFCSIPLEKNDLLHLIWKGIKQELDEYDEKKNYSIFNGFVQKGYQKSIREAIKFLTNGHILLNTAYSIEKIGDKTLKKSDGTFFQNKEYEQITKELIEQVTPYFAKHSQKRVKRIIYLKSCGFSLVEISKKIRVPISEVRTLFNGIKNIGEILYKFK